MGSHYNKPCPSCKGKGIIDKELCESCEGTGVTLYDERYDEIHSLFASEEKYFEEEDE